MGRQSAAARKRATAMRGPRNVNRAARCVPQRDPAEISSENRRRSTLPPAAETRWVALLRPPPGRGRGTKSELRSPGCATGVENNRPALPDVRVGCFTILAELRKAARHVPQNKRKKTTCRMDDVSLLQVKSQKKERGNSRNPSHAGPRVTFTRLSSRSSGGTNIDEHQPKPLAVDW